MELRRIAYWSEELMADAGGRLARPVRRAAGLAVIRNPYAGRLVEDLSPLFEVGFELGTLLMKRVVDLLGAEPVSYGKAAVVGTLGEVEHGAALIHPKLGKSMREAIGGGQAIIPSNAKVAAPGALVDVPLGHKDNVWSFDHFDTMTVFVPDAPRADEIVVIMAVADAGRPRPRVGQGRIQ
ncbi:MAG: amino acid synthesis family protein [Candidatus Rokuibacteriota bacterium]